MLTKRHHFSVEVSDGIIDALVPDEGGYEIALDRLRADDPAWSGDARYHGMKDHFERIVFSFSEHRKTA